MDPIEGQFQNTQHLPVIPAWNYLGLETTRRPESYQDQSNAHSQDPDPILNQLGIGVFRRINMSKTGDHQSFRWELGK